MKKTLILTAGLFLLSMSLFAQNWPYFPKTSVLEICVNEEVTAFNNGLNAADEAYPDDEGIVLRYYSSSSSLGNADTQAMINQLGASVLPSAYFNGQIKVKGSKAHLNDGNAFKAMIEKEKYDASRVYIHNVSFNAQTGAITGIVMDALDSNPIQNMTIHYLIVENNVSGMNNVVRKIVSDPLAIATDGDNFTINKTLAIEAGWNAANLKAVVMIRNNQGKVIQARSNESIPYRKLRFVSPQPRYAVSSEAYYEMPYIAVMNTDFNANYVVDFTIGTEDVYKPENWMFTYCDHNNCFFGDSQHSMSAGYYLEFHPSVTSSGNGSALFNFKVVVENMPDIRIPFNFLTSSADVLVIDDDGVKNTESSYMSGLANIGMTYAVADMSIFDFEGFDFSAYQNIIWNMHNPYTQVNNTILSELKNHIGSGANLYIAGTSVGWALTNNNSTVYTEATDDFYSSMTGAFLGGVILSTVGDIMGYGNIGENVTMYFDSSIPEYIQIEPEIFAYHTLRPDNIIFSINNYDIGRVNYYQLGRIAYTTFGIEGINWNLDMSLAQHLLVRIMRWFGNSTSNEEIVKPQSDRLSITTYPNPFSQTSNIDIESKTTASLADIEIFNSKGQRVHQQSIQLNNGKSSYSWNGKDLTGKNCSNGIYFIKVNNGNQTQTKKVLRFK